MRAAPSFARQPSAQSIPPARIVRRLLARFGDRRYVRGIEIGTPPPRRLIKGFFRSRPPPRNAAWAYIDAPLASQLTTGPVGLSEKRARARAYWEVQLIGGALRDDFCDAGGRPLVGWSIGHETAGVSSQYALGQRFPNPSPKAFRERASAVGKRYGFGIASLRLLRPRQLAPMLVVETNRDRKAFVRDVPKIMLLLDPVSHGRAQSALTFEGFRFEARDSTGPFVDVENVYRGGIMGGQWSWNRCAYPYEHGGFFGDKPCPPD
jgi:hypothetical protein